MNKITFKILVFLLLWQLAPNKILAQGAPACPQVNAGAGTGPNVDICLGSSATLTASLVTNQATTSYTVASIPYAPYAYTGGTAVSVSTDDVWSPVVNLPFKFCYFGNTFDKCIVGSNGHLSFNTTNANGTDAYPINVAIPSLSNMPGNTINAVFRDITPAGGAPAKVAYYITGTAPCRALVVYWTTVPLFNSILGSCNSKPKSTFQLVLYENTNFIDVYVDQSDSCSDWNGGYGIIGIQNATGTVAVVPPGRNYPSAWSSTGEAWRFTPTGTPSYTFKWYETANPAVTLGTSLSLTVSPTVTTSYTAEMVLTNCDGTTVTKTDNVTVTVKTPAVAGTDGSDSVCTSSSAVIDLFGLISGEAAGGAWTRTGGTGGTFTAAAGTFNPSGATSSTFQYTVTGVAPCPNDSSLATVNITSPITPTFTAVAPICSGDSLSALPTTSNNGITGTWSPALNNTATTNYTFTPTAGLCAIPANLTITVNSLVTPTFTAIAPICSGDSLSALPTTSNNGITGAWSPALNNTATTNYTFTPTAGLCAIPANLTITVNSPVTPTFTAVAPICSGDSLSALPTTSNNGFTGTWSPALNNTVTTTYTFTPTSGLCATTTDLTITVNSPVTPTFTAVAPICSGDSLSALPTTSNNGFTGTWSPALNNTASTTYTFTPASGLCATTADLTITVNSPVTPIFTTPLPICSGDAAPILPPTSNNGITGVWAPSPVSNTATNTYTFTPDAGECATTTELTVTVEPPVTPAFTQIPPFCSGAAAPSLPLNSNEGITGTWDPSTVNNTASGTYTFTPDAGQCAIETTMSITVNPIEKPTINCGVSTVSSVEFNWSAVVGATGYDVSYTVNAVPGPAVGSVGTATTYTVTGLAAGDTVEITVTPTPVGAAGTCYTFNTQICVAIVCAPPTATISYASPFCVIDTALQTPVLTSTGDQTGATYTADNGLIIDSNTGAFTPSANLPGNYTVTYTIPPATAGCPTITATATVVIESGIVPTFTAIDPICAGDTAPVLPTSSTNSPAITGTWFPPVVSNTTTGTYTFTPDAGQCAEEVSLTVTVNPKVMPTFDLIAPICSGDPAPLLPTSSTNSPAITGAWTPAVDTTTTTTYTFIPTAGQCAEQTTLTIMVNSNIVPTFVAVAPICSGDAAPVLPTSSTNSPAISGTWNPSTVDNTTSGTYIFTPDAGQCATMTTLDVTVNSNIVPTFNAVAPICSGDTPPVLPTSSTNSPAITGTWSPSTVSNIASGIYTFTPAAGQCANIVTLNVTVGAPINPVFTPIAPICSGDVAPVLPTSSNNSPPVTGTWSPSTVSNTSSGTYTFTPTAGVCANPATLDVTVNPILSPTINCGVSTLFSIQFTWSAVTGATGYDVSYKVNSASTVVVGGVGNVLFYDVTGLSAADSVVITVTPTGSAGTCFTSSTQTCFAVNCTPPTANISYASPFCESDTSSRLPTLTGTGVNTGGIYTADGGLIINPLTGAIIPSTATNTNHTITYIVPASAGCSTVTATTTIAVNPVLNAGTDGAITVCENSSTPIDLYSLITGGQSGGNWIRTGGSGGAFNAIAGTYIPAVGATTSTFEYTLAALAPCTNDSSEVIVTITPQTAPTITCGIPSSTTVQFNWTAVPGATGYDVSYQVTGNPATPTTSVGGVLTYTVSSLNPGDTVTITVTPTGGVGGCFASSTQACTASTCPVSTANISYATPFCDNNGTPQSVTLTGTGTYIGGDFTSSSPAGLSIDAITGAITPNASGIYVVTYKLTGTGGCPDVVATATVNVTALPTAAISYAGTPFCKSLTTGQAVTLTGTGAYTGGTYSASSGLLSINLITGAIRPDLSFPGSYTVTYSTPASGGCQSVSVTTDVIITEKPSATISYSPASFCISDTTTKQVTITGVGAYTGGMYSSNPAGLLINPVTGDITGGIAGIYTVTYTIPASAGCAEETAPATVTVYALPVATATPINQTFCSGGTTNIVLTSNIPGTAFSWTVAETDVTGATAGNGNSIAQTLTAINPVAAGTVTYTVTPIANGCIGLPITVDIIVNPAPNVIATPANQTICSGQTSGIILTSTTPGTTFTWTASENFADGASNGSGNFISQVLTSTGGLGTVTYAITPTSGNCVGTPIVVVLTVTPPPPATATPDSQTICSGQSTNIVLTSTIPGTIFNWNVIETNVTGATAGSGNTINQVLTTIPGSSNPGLAVYAVTPESNGCPGETIYVNITINPIPVATANPDAPAPICSGETTAINLSSNLPGTTFSWAVIASGVFGATSGTGDFIAQTLTTINNNVQGSVDYVITPFVNGCQGAQIIVTVTVKPTPEVFGSSQTTICSGFSPNITLFPSIPGTTFTWTQVATGVSGASDGNGSSINDPLTATGTTAGTVVYTVTPTADDCIGLPSNFTVIVNPSPTPLIENGVICVDANGQTFQSYTLDTGFNNANYDFVWYFNNSTSPIQDAYDSFYEATEAGIYSVEVTDTITGCVSALVSATVTESYPATDIILTPSNYFSDNATITVTATPTPAGATYFYSLDNGPVQESNVFAPVSPGEHSVTVTDANGCTNETRSIFIIDYPHYFTPNGDGINDFWNIIGLSDQPNAKIYIFDRYGKLIKQISPTGEGWDGTYNGELLPSTDYWFTVDYIELGGSKLFKAHFSLKR